jgi:hypothetical protein
VRVVEGRTDAAIALQRLGEDVAVHLIRYDYDEQADRVPALDRLTLDIRLPRAFGSVRAFDPMGRMRAGLEPTDDGVRLALSDVGVYGIARLSG